MKISEFYYFIISFLQRPGFDFRDLLDFMVIFALFFLLLSLIRMTKSTVVFKGLFLLGIVYAISSLIGLPITTLVFRSFFSVSLLIIAVVFQKELRRFFGLLGTIGIGAKIIPPPEDSQQTIIKTAEKMAKNRTGALIIIPGRENIERHLEGGVKLNGHISQQLILSIFDNTSPGHDGAMLINKDLVRRFGVHLPLSESTEATKNMGTRHRAALGLAESSDAFCIVVSEEKGVISVAHNKKITPIKDIKELEKHLRAFTEEVAPSLTISYFRKWFVKSSNILFHAFWVTVVVWLIFTYQMSIK